jgi:flagellar basal body-associated protein FliL
MSPKIKKILLICLGVILLTLTTVGVIGYMTYSKSLNKEAEFKVPNFSLNPKDKIKLGDLIHAVVSIKCPWGHYPVKVDFTPEEGIQEVDDPKIFRSKTKWGENIWNVELTLQAYRTGEIKEERGVIIFSSDAESPIERRVAAIIPAFNVLAVETGKDSILDIASTVAHPRMARKSTWLVLSIATLLFIIAIVILYFVFRKRKEIEAAIVIPPWTKALNNLHELRNLLSSHKINRQVAVAKITDIVRNYLEKRFKITVTAKTTYEFLKELDKGRGPLTDDNRNFLREFLQAADFVKFAKLPADDDMVENAITKAESLINSTKLNDDDLSSNKKGN